MAARSKKATAATSIECNNLLFLFFFCTNIEKCFFFFGLLDFYGIVEIKRKLILFAKRKSELS